MLQKNEKQEEIMRKRVLLVAAALFMLTPLTAQPTKAVPLGITKGAVSQPDILLENVRFVARGGAVVGPRGGVAVRSSAVVRPGYRGGGVRWARPGGYWWRPGGAIAAGAAIGFVAAATAVAWAGAAPAPNMCWYYTDQSRRQGFWDACP
jgi:hypothetical protein